MPRQSQEAFHFDVADGHRIEQGDEQRIISERGKAACAEQLLRRQPSGPCADCPRHAPPDVRTEPDEAGGSLRQFAGPPPGFGQGANHGCADAAVVLREVQVFGAGDEDVFGFRRFPEMQGVVDDIQGRCRVALRIEQQREAVQCLDEIRLDL